MRNRIIRTTAGAVALAIVGAVGGCVSSGLSPREERGRDYATYVYSMPELAADAGSILQPAPLPEGISPSTQPVRREAVVAPARVAVAQVGELAPPSEMLKTLRDARGAFSSVQPIPGIIETPAYVPPRVVSGGPEAQEAAVRAARQAMQRDAHARADQFRQFARQVGADYLFLYGGTVDRSTTSTPLSLANATIIGIFIVPSEQIQASATASGALIDVNTGRVVLVASASDRKETLSPTVAKKGDELKLLSSLRDEVVTHLADNLVSQVKSQAPAGS